MKNDARSRRSLPPRSAKRKQDDVVSTTPNASGAKSGNNKGTASRSPTSGPAKKKRKVRAGKEKEKVKTVHKAEHDAQHKKRLVPGSDVQDETQSSDDSIDLSYRWIDLGDPQGNGVKDHKLLEMIVEGTTTIVSVGDHMLLRSSDETPQSYNNQRETGGVEEAFVARIEKMWEVPAGRKKSLREHCMKIRARWFFKVRDSD